MDLILHLGAHRTATASFQDHIRRQSAALASQGIGFWGQRRAQDTLHAHILSQDAPMEMVSQKINRRLERARRFALRRLVISDVNMIGSVAENISTAALYPDAGSRMARFGRVFGERITTVLFCPRSLELYWCSALSSGVHAGAAIPDRATIRKIAMSRRGWRDVITDIATALPNARFQVVPYEQYQGAPSALMQRDLDIETSGRVASPPRNVAPTLPELRRALSASGRSGAVLPFGMGRWNPFQNDEHAALRELYADDMMWLAAGADGLTTQTQDCVQNEVGPTPPLHTEEKGRCDERQERQLARPG